MARRWWLWFCVGWDRYGFMTVSGHREQPTNVTLQEFMNDLDRRQGTRPRNGDDRGQA